MTFNATRFGLAGGIICGLFFLVITWISMFNGYAMGYLNLIGSVYPGYTVSFLGSLIGFAYGFVECFVAFFIFAWLYNWLESL
ncbi:hypothetical protein CMO83_03875 [Candidatus Woesearchaeota archaeon]|nr:hypothetical protein [Candidatus Woesearchaeota archaeon]MAG91788.1 hypothetical protein [Candidatus Woesearchaeota archaeon]|tara:strand:+ start:24339 stop:24587 length:249 start_codon:yes stop_codon:yes gene_type:complete